jgi:hypothetical protein
MRTVCHVSLVLIAFAIFALLPGSMLATYWPWLLALGCLLMHLFMHCGHGLRHSSLFTSKGE